MISLKDKKHDILYKTQHFHMCGIEEKESEKTGKEVKEHQLKNKEKDMKKCFMNSVNKKEAFSKPIKLISKYRNIKKKGLIKRQVY